MSQTPERKNNLAGMRDVWCWALSWYRKPPVSQEKRVMQSVLVQAIKEEILNQLTERGVALSVKELHELYAENAFSLRSLQIARERFPRQWSTLSIHATTAVAFGLAYVEMMTRRKLDAREPLPHWLGEWAIW